eukprot:75882-Hanusia_phi.AAC.2
MSKADQLALQLRQDSRAGLARIRSYGGDEEARGGAVKSQPLVLVAPAPARALVESFHVAPRQVKQRVH